MVELFLVRHGETEENADRILQGHIPGRLSASGREQVVALRKRLEHEHFDVLIASDLQRTMDSASILNEAFALPVVALPLLRERDWGSFTGRHIDEVQGIDFPPDVESVSAMERRASLFLQYLRTHHDGQRVLAVGHGLFNRCIQSVLFGRPMRDIERMSNAEVRILHVV